MREQWLGLFGGRILGLREVEHPKSRKVFKNFIEKSAETANFKQFFKKFTDILFKFCQKLCK